MPSPDIHERLIARLEELYIVELSRCQSREESLQVSARYDMALYAVRAKCPKCGDLGFVVHTGEHESIRYACDCKRPALLAEWERQLGGRDES